jgi:hypothetical protein
VRRVRPRRAQDRATRNGRGRPRPFDGQAIGGRRGELLPPGTWSARTAATA